MCELLNIVGPISAGLALADSRQLAKSDSCICPRRETKSRWNLIKNTITFINRSKEVVKASGEYEWSMADILTEDLKLEICRLQGVEFDLYLNCLATRDCRV